jgi:hypothetical protein
MNEEIRKSCTCKVRKIVALAPEGATAVAMWNPSIGISHWKSGNIATWRYGGVSERFMLLNQESQPARGMIVAIDIVLGCRLL